MLASAVLHGAGWIQARLPWWALCTLMVALGAISGARFADSNRRALVGLFQIEQLVNGMRNGFDRQDGLVREGIK